jgi:hypothetical protein
MMPATRTGFVRRVLGAALLDARCYEEVEADPDATPQAIVVVLLAAVAAGLGSAGTLSPGGMAVRILSAGVSWVAWAAIVTQVGGRMLPEPQTRVTTSELLRTLGFAAAPGLIQVARVVPGLNRPLLVLAWLWMLAAMVVAIRQALDYRHTARAVMVCVVGGALALAVTLAIGVLFSTPVW